VLGQIVEHVHIALDIRLESIDLRIARTQSVRASGTLGPPLVAGPGTVTTTEPQVLKRGTGLCSWRSQIDRFEAKCRELYEHMLDNLTEHRPDLERDSFVMQYNNGTCLGWSVDDLGARAETRGKRLLRASR